MRRYWTKPASTPNISAALPYGKPIALAARLADYPGKVVLMKGTAYAAAGLKASEGRHIGDLDIMVAREDLAEVEATLLAAGWEWVKARPL